jgi:hypothetical protein
MDRGDAQRVIEHAAGHDPAPTWIRDPVDTCEDDSPVAGADDDQVTHIDTRGLGHVKVCEHLQTPRTDEVAACLVSWEPRLVDQCDAGAGAGKDKGGGAARRAGSHDEHVKAPRSHGDSFHASTVYGEILTPEEAEWRRSPLLRAT